jgi:hypothetical protein
MLHSILFAVRIRPPCGASCSFAGTPTQSLWIKAALAAAALTLASAAPSAFGGLIAYEGFDYSLSTGLASSANTGIGWTSNWTNNNWRTNSGSSGEISTGLTYSGLTTVGNAARNAGGEDYRSFAEQSASGTYWVSFLVQVDSTAHRDFGISLFDGGSEKVFMGQTLGANGNLSLWQNPSYDSRADSEAAPVANTPMLFVAEFDMVSGKAWFWIDPSLPQNSPSYASAVNGEAGSSISVFTFDSVRMYGSGGYFDEIRIGTTAQDVGFTSAIPEPSAWVGVAGSVALSFVGLCRRRSLRRSNAASA